MRELCHRCSGDLPSGDGVSPFCPHCGAPQLFLTESYVADPQDQSATGETTGTQPPPLPRQVDWQAALRSALIVGAVAAILSIVSLRVPGVSLVNTLWILTASVTTLALYHRLRPLAWMDASVGARIGLTTGLAVIVLVAAAMASAGLVARFGLHAMVGFDAYLTQTLLQAKETAVASSSQAAPEVIKLYDLPEFQAGLVLTSIAMSSLFLLAFSTLGGALGGMLRTRRRARL